jgi:acyl-CoA thioester hydrolase
MTIITEKEETADLTSADTYKHWIRESIRFADLDPLAHVNNIAFATYYESARVRFFSDNGFPVDDKEIFWMAVKISIEFKAQMNWPGHVDIGTSVVRMGRTSMVIGGALFVDGSCTSTSECIMVCVDPETSRPTEIPDSLRQRFLAREL